MKCVAYGTKKESEDALAAVNKDARVTGNRRVVDPVETKDGRWALPVWGNVERGTKRKGEEIEIKPVEDEQH